MVRDYPASVKESCEKARAISQPLVVEGFSDAFRRHVGPGKRFTVDGFAELSGIHRNTLDAYRAGTQCPGLEKFMVIAAILGADVLDAMKDGKIDHLERADLLPKVMKASGTIIGFARALGGAK